MRKGALESILAIEHLLGLPEDVPELLLKRDLLERKLAEFKEFVKNPNGTGR
ncbi:MAG: hypothetical protein ACYTHN_09270 [Planctomycetota bacterium]